DRTRERDRSLSRNFLTRAREGRAFMRRIGSALVSCLWLAWLAPTSVHAQRVAAETFMVPAVDPGIQLYVRNKHLEGRDNFTAERIVLFVHGATYPSETVFDIDLPGGSWADLVAKKGYDVYLVDVRGYGGSTRPAAMDAPPADHAPLAT